MYSVYILRTLDDTLYVDVRGSLRQRIASPNSGKTAEWTKAHPGARCAQNRTLRSVLHGDAKPNSSDGREQKKKRSSPVIWLV